MNQSFVKQFGELMNQTRKKRGLSYEQLRDKMEVPKAKSTLKRYEDDKSEKLDYFTMRDICDVLMLDIEKIYDTFQNTGSLAGVDLELHGGLTNKQIAQYTNEALFMMPQEFKINYSQLSEEHKQVVHQITAMYAADDSNKPKEK
jgi:transcriptional regulator with XRE-family HTH domain